MTTITRHEDKMTITLESLTIEEQGTLTFAFQMAFEQCNDPKHRRFHKDSGTADRLKSLWNQLEDGFRETFRNDPEHPDPDGAYPKDEPII